MLFYPLKSSPPTDYAFFPFFLYGFFGRTEVVNPLFAEGNGIKFRSHFFFPIPLACFQIVFFFFGV